MSKSGNADMDSNSQEDMDKSIFGCILTLIYDDDNYYFFIGFWSERTRGVPDGD